MLTTWLARLSAANKKRRALRRRKGFADTCFIGVTGSGGKSTAVRLLQHLLAPSFHTYASAVLNSPHNVLKRLMAMRRSTGYAYAVFEISGHEPGAVAASCDLVQPAIGIVTVVGSDHRSSLRSLDNTAREKGVLVERVPADGLVLLNRDDSRVYAMRERSRARVMTYGTGAGADYRATNVGVNADGVLHFECRHGAETVPFRIGLPGRHFVVSALAAIAASHQQGIALSELARRMADFQPVAGRCSTHRTAGGVTFVCDTAKAPAWSVLMAVEMLADFTNASRRTLVLGSLSDATGSMHLRYRKAVRAALERADRILFFGEMAAHARVDGEHLTSGKVAYVADIVALRQVLRDTQQPGELILLKGSTTDHLERVAVNFDMQGGCWSTDCAVRWECFNCGKLDAGGGGAVKQPGPVGTGPGR